MVNIRNDAWLISKGAIEHLISIYRTHVTVFPRHSLKKRLSMAGSPFCWTVAVTSTCFVDVIPQLHSSYLVCGFSLSENSSQLGWLFPIYRKIKHVPNHQPVIVLILDTAVVDIFWTNCRYMPHSKASTVTISATLPLSCSPHSRPFRLKQLFFDLLQLLCSSFFSS